jgi:uncharacterized phage protein gp47/JayE
MPHRRPTLTQLRKQARAFFAARLEGADTTLANSNITVSADNMAGMINGIYGYLDFLADNLLPQTMGESFLIRYGGMFDLAPTPSVTASGHALFRGIAGTPVPNATQLQDSLQNLYQTVGTVNLGVGDTSIPVVALTGGADGNLAPGAPLTLVSAIAGVNASATVDGSGFSGGMDGEALESFRARVLERRRNPPGGSGTVADYKRWAKTVAGVTRVSVFGAARGPGTVDLRFVMDGRADIVPLSGDIAAVQAAVVAQAPLTDVPGIVTSAPTLQAVNYTLSAILFGHVRLQIASILADLHGKLEIGDGLSVQAQIIPALGVISNLPGNFLTAPAVDIASDPTKLLTLGTISYV